MKADNNEAAYKELQTSFKQQVVKPTACVGIISFGLLTEKQEGRTPEVNGIIDDEVEIEPSVIDEADQYFEKELRNANLSIEIFVVI